MTQSLLPPLQEICRLLETLEALLESQHNALVTRQTVQLQQLAGKIEKHQSSLSAHAAQYRSQLTRQGYISLNAWLQKPDDAHTLEELEQTRSVHREYIARALQCQQQRDTNRCLLERQYTACQVYMNQLSGLNRQRYDANGQRVHDRGRHRLSQS